MFSVNRWVKRVLESLAGLIFLIGCMGFYHTPVLSSWGLDYTISVHFFVAGSLLYMINPLISIREKRQ
ncbi:YrhK family protein [Endozoicomonas sp. Mp262]|uniref:YrhK family protein n=1 Tax=Endozoicomonas sp. Mp262 TaxID=2919499 RepID=UPI0021DB5854